MGAFLITIAAWAEKVLPNSICLAIKTGGRLIFAVARAQKSAPILAFVTVRMSSDFEVCSMVTIPVKVYEPISTITEALPTEGTRMSGFAARLIGRQDAISSEALNANLSKFLSGIGDALEGIPSTLAGFKIHEIELAIEVGAKGEVCLIVGSAELEGKAGVKLKLVRS
jgi:hypothetical protein